MSSSEMMPALLLTQTGSPLDFFKRGEIGKPKAGHGELLARIKCTALNPVDWKVCVRVCVRVSMCASARASARAHCQR